MTPFAVDVAVLINFFTRPDHLERLFAQLRQARPSVLFLYQDGPRSEADMAGIMACRRVVDEAIDWECTVHRKYQERNYGVDPSGYIAQRWAFSVVDKCIVLEDDDVPAVSWFAFCKTLLDRYEHDERIGMITAFNPEEITPAVSADYFFSSNFSIWGWASWRRVIDTWQGDYAFMDEEETMADLRAVAKEKGLHDGLLGMMPVHRASGKAHYESIFYSALLLNSQLAIVPTRNMLNNNGVTPDATHFSGSLATLPRGYRRIFTMKRHELDVAKMKHPRYVIDHLAYRHSVYRIMAWRHPWIKVGRAFEELFLNLRYGNFSFLTAAVKRRLNKWRGRG